MPGCRVACGDQRRLTGNGSALEVVLHDYALYKSAFTLLYFTVCLLRVDINMHCAHILGLLSMSKIKQPGPRALGKFVDSCIALQLV